jgi:phenylacetate-CoA ligase
MLPYVSHVKASTPIATQSCVMEERVVSRGHPHGAANIEVQKVKKSYDISVVAPCFNEERNVGALVQRLQLVFQKKKLKGEIVLVDDASTDGTRAAILPLQKEWPNVALVIHDKNRGIWAGWSDGLARARGTYVCFIDADLQNLPEDVWHLYREITLSNVDLVSGCRTHVGLKKGLSLVASRGLNALLNFVFGMHLSDNKSGFVIARKETLRHVLAHRFRYRHPQTFITVSANAKGYRIRQIETLFESRRSGLSYLAGASFWKVAWHTLIDVCKGFVEFRLLREKDDPLRHFLSINAPHLVMPSQPKLQLWRRLWLLVYRLAWPLHHWLVSSHVLELQDLLNRSQWLPKDRIREYQGVRLRSLINHVYHHVHFYRDVFDELGLKPDDVRTIDDLLKLPIIDKRVVQENIFMGQMSNNHSKADLHRVRTSGSTGEPFFTFLEKRQVEMRIAATARSFEWSGYRFGDRQLRLWHKYLALTWSQIVREIIDAKLTRRAFIPAYEMDENGLEKFMRAIDRVKPVLIDGYAESFNFIAKYIKSRGWRGHRPKGIMTSGQMLPEASRRIIEEAFGCKVFDKYGAREFGGGLAYECEEHDGYHVVAECAIIEIIKDGQPAKPGEMGELVITELNNFAVPLIRYRIGDLAVQMDNSKPCRCGRGLPRIGRIEGRIQAIIIGTNNRFVPGTFFARLFSGQEHIVKQFQVTQEKPGVITMNIVKGPLFAETSLEPAFREIRKHLGEDISITMNYTDLVKLGATGKRHHSLSTVDVDEILDMMAKS